MLMASLPSAAESAAALPEVLPDATRPALDSRWRDRRDPEAAQSSFAVHFLIPITLIVGLAMIALVGGALWLTTLQNRAEGVNERARVKASFEARVEAVAATTRVFGVWDDAARKVLATFDPVWIDVNIGAYVFDHEGFEATFVTDETGRPIYGYVDSERSPADPAAVLGPGYAKAMSRAVSTRALLNEPLSGVSLSPRGTAIFGIVRVRPHGPVFGVPTDVTRYLVMAKFVDDKVVKQVERASNGGTLSFDERMDSGRSRWSFEGSGARGFTWVPDRPGARLLRDVAPWLALLLLVIGGLAWVVLQRARKAARALIASETKALYIANRDSLTGLPNRRAFAGHLHHLRRSGEQHALMFLDLDGFKKVNDRFGHDVGDTLLCRTAERLQRLLPPSAFLARLGGDEFAIILPRPDDRGELDRLAARVVEAIGKPHDFAGEPATVGVSIGVAANDRGDYSDVLREADSAMYAAKALGRNQWQFYQPIPPARLTMAGGKMA